MSNNCMRKPHLKPESVSHIDELEDDHHGQGRGEGAVSLVRFKQHGQVQHHPADQTWTQFAEELEIQGAYPGVQLMAHEEIIDDISCKKIK